MNDERSLLVTSRRSGTISLIEEGAQVCTRKQDRKAGGQWEKRVYLRGVKGYLFNSRTTPSLGADEDMLLTA